VLGVYFLMPFNFTKSRLGSAPSTHMILCMVISSDQQVKSCDT
jgi:hypothetical protein